MDNAAGRVTIKFWAEEDRPREKLLLKGRHSLSDAELVAILIASGNVNETAVELSRRILQSYGNNLDKLGKLSVKDLMQFKGIGEAKAISIVAALELGRRRKEWVHEPRASLGGSADVYNEMMPIFRDLYHEEFWMLLLNRSNKVISKKLISKGGISGTVADPKLIFKDALEQLACNLVFCHNHPSGNKKPSEADIRLTKKLKAAGELLEISVLDHLIVTDSGYFSFADEGLM